LERAFLPAPLFPKEAAPMNRGKAARVVLILIAMLSVNTFLPLAVASSVQVEKQINLMVSDSRQKNSAYGASNTATVSGFKRSDSGKYLMIGLGPESISAVYSTAVSYTGKFPDDMCKLEGGPLGVGLRSTDLKRSAFFRQLILQEHCIRIMVRDAGASTLSLPAVQPNCIVERVDQSTVLASGGYCYFPVSPGSDFEVQFGLNPLCSSPQFLEQHAIDAQDIFLGAGFFLAGDASGYSTDLESIGFTRMRLTLEPSGKIFPVSMDDGSSTPLWPLRLSADVHMGDLRVLPPPPAAEDNAPVIDSSLLVRNICPSRCRLGICESECDFAAAAGAQMELYSLDRTGKERLLDIWYAGGVAPAQWEGMIPSSYKLSNGALKFGERYRLVANFDYPGIYYQLLSGGFQQNLINLKVFSDASLASGRPLPTLGDMSASRSRMPGLPQVGGLPALGASDLGAPFQTALDTLKNMFNVPNWPPYYEEFCFGERGCLSLRSGSARTRVGIDFDYSGLDVNGEGSLRDIILWRKSEVLGDYQQRMLTPPKFRCGW
jgi:hypothetical protein